MTPEELGELEARIRGLNPYARLHRTQRAKIDINEVLGRNAFDLDRILDIEPSFLDSDEHHHDHDHDHNHEREHDHDHGHHHHGNGLKHYHDEEMQSVSIKTDKPLNPDKFFPWIQDLVAKGGANIRLLGLRGASVLEGGIPIIVDGKLIGAVGVSGAASEQDAQVAQAGADALKK